MKRILLVGLLFFSFSYAKEVLHLDLEQAIDIAKTNNAFLLEMQQLVEEAQAGKTESFTKWFPKIEGTYQMYRDQRINPLSGSRNNFMTQLSLTQSILNTEKYFGLKLAKLQLEQMKLLELAALNDVLLDVRSTYYKIVQDLQTMQTAKEKVDLLTNLAIQMQDRNKIGTAKQYDVNQSQVMVANATNAFYEAKKQYKIDVDLFTKILGYDPGTVEIQIKDFSIPVKEIPVLKNKLDHVENIFASGYDFSPIYQEGFPFTEHHKMQKLFSMNEVKNYQDIASHWNPMLRSKNTELNIAQKKLGEQWGTYLPEVHAAANLGGMPDPFDFFPTSTFKSQTMRWGIGLEVSWLIFDSLGRESRIRKAKHVRNSKEYALRKEKQEVFFQLQSQLHDIEEAVSSYVTSLGNVKLAEQTLLQASEQLDIGYIDIFDYQISIDGLIQARNHFNQASYELINAYFGLIHAIGIDTRETGKNDGRE